MAYVCLQVKAIYLAERHKLSDFLSLAAHRETCCLYYLACFLALEVGETIRSNLARK